MGKNVQEIKKNRMGYRILCLSMNAFYSLILGFIK